MLLYVSNQIEQRELVHSVQSECRKVRLELNAKKTECMYSNTKVERIETIDRVEIKQTKTDYGDKIANILATGAT